MAFGRRQRASILIRPDPVLSILSPRSSQTTQSESHETTNSLKRHDWTNSNLWKGAARYPRVARDVTTNAPGERARVDERITKAQKHIFAPSCFAPVFLGAHIWFCLLYKCFPSLSLLPTTGSIKSNQTTALSAFNEFLAIINFNHYICTSTHPFLALNLHQLWNVSTARKGKELMQQLTKSTWCCRRCLGGNPADVSSFGQMIAEYQQMIKRNWINWQMPKSLKT